MPTTLAKTKYLLETSDFQRIQGYRQPGARSTLTMYYVNDLAAASLAKHGQHRFDNEVPEGKELSGVADKERSFKQEKERAAAQVVTDKDPYTTVPPERLSNLGIAKLQAILSRCPGGLYGADRSSKMPRSKAEAVERILKAGYSIEKARCSV
jgi:hypothetical protein